MFCLSSKKITQYGDEINNISEVIKHSFLGFVFLGGFFWGGGVFYFSLLWKQMTKTSEFVLDHENFSGSMLILV